MKYTVPFLLAYILTATNANPLSNGRRITFSTAMSIDHENVEYNENEPEEGTPEYYKSFQWIAVTSEGMEYEGTPEEVMNYMNFESDLEEDMGEQEPPETTENTYVVDHIANDWSKLDDQSDDKDQALQQMLTKGTDEMKQTLEKRSVIGSDDRRKIRFVNRFPYNAMGRIDIGCTGTFIARRTVLTAGHCVHSGGRNGKWVRPDRLVIRRSKNCDPHNGVQSHAYERAMTLTGWKFHKYPSFDIAVIIVKQPSPVVMAFEAAGSFAGKYNIAGYPVDKPGKCLYSSTCKIQTVGTNRLFYPCDTNGGMSGSAVYRYNWYARKYVIHAVHAYGGRSINSGTRITGPFKSWINSILRN